MCNALDMDPFPLHVPRQLRLADKSRGILRGKDLCARPGQSMSRQTLRESSPKVVLDDFYIVLFRL